MLSRVLGLLLQRELYLRSYCLVSKPLLNHPVDPSDPSRGGGPRDDGGPHGGDDHGGLVWGT